MPNSEIRVSFKSVPPAYEAANWPTKEQLERMTPEEAANAVENASSRLQEWVDKYAVRVNFTQVKELGEKETTSLVEDAWYSTEPQDFGRCVRQEHIGSCIYRYTVDVSALTDSEISETLESLWRETLIPLPAKYGRSTENGLGAACTYYAAPVFVNGDYEFDQTPLITDDPGALVAKGRGAGDRWDVVRVTLNPPSPEALEVWVNAGIDPNFMFAFRHVMSGQIVTLADLLDGASYLRATFLAAAKIEEARQASESADPPRQDTNRPHRQYDPNSKLANTMTAPALFDPAGAFLDVASATEKKRGKDVETAVTLSTDDGVDLSRPISAYDREVHGAISTLWVSDNRYVTARQVAQSMGIRNPTKNQVRKVEESIELQRRIMGRIDLRQEARGRRLSFEDEEVTQFTLEGHLINADRVTIKAANGREVDGYYLYRPPLIYQHAATINQVVSYPQKLLELGTGSDTDANIILKRQLLRQVERAKTGGQKSIRFTPDPKNPERPCLFTRAGIDVTDWDKRKAATDYALSILEGLKEFGEISGYTTNRQKVRGGNPVYGVTVKP